MSLRLTTARLEIARDNRDWFRVARIYDEVGDEELRDHYADLAFAESVPLFYRVLILDMQGRIAEITEAEWDEVIDYLQEDWSSQGYVMLKGGRLNAAANCYLDGVKKVLDEGNYFTAAFYLRHALNTNVVDELFLLALKEAVAEGDLWWQVRCFEELGWAEEKRELLLGNASEISRSDDLHLKFALASAQQDTKAIVATVKQIESSFPRVHDDSEPSDLPEGDGT